MKRYERIREIFNNCDNSQMDIREVETDDVDAAVQEFCSGKHVICDKFIRIDGAVVFEISADGLNQRVTFTELEAK